MINYKSQEGRILRLLRERGEQGVKVYELITPRPEGEGCSQYGARIFSLRRKGFNIINKEVGHFVLIEDKPVFNPVTQKYEYR